MSRELVVKWLVVGAIVAAGCSSNSTSGPDLAVAPCTSNNDCASKKCDNKMACVECVTGGDCRMGQKCVNKACATGCDDKSPCPTGKVCDLGKGACVECVTDKDCPATTPRCDQAGGQLC